MAAQPPATEADQVAFNQRLNERMPRTRAIAQGLLRSESGEVLLCRLTYKSDADLPGGIVDPGESPAACLAREIREELGWDLAVGRLLVVNWLPPYRGWDDALLFLFDLGIAPRTVTETAQLLSTEVEHVMWVEPAHLGGQVAAYTEAVVRQALAQPDRASYLEDSKPWPAN